MFLQASHQLSHRNLHYKYLSFLWILPWKGPRIPVNARESLDITVYASFQIIPLQSVPNNHNKYILFSVKDSVDYKYTIWIYEWV